MKKAEIFQIDETTCRFSEYALRILVYSYLLIGKERALLIDTGYGFTDIAGAIKQITALPLLVVNTHGHLDHTHGNHFFEEVYLSEKDGDVFIKHNTVGGARQLAKDLEIPYFLTKIPPLNKFINRHASKHIRLPKEMYFELGGRRVRIVETPGHTVGSICLLDEKNGWLFSGDTTCTDGVLLHFSESTTVAVFRESIRKIQALVGSGKVKALFPAHQKTPVSLDVLDKFERAATDIIEGVLTDEEIKKGLHAVGGTAIRFDKEKIV